MDALKIMRRLANVFVRGVYQARATDLTLTARQLSGEVHSKLPHPQESGFASKHTAGKTHTIYNGGNRDDGTVLILESNAPPTLADGETAVYSQGGIVIKLTAGGIVTITGATALNVSGNVSDLQGTAQTMAAMRTIFNGHKHSPTGTAPTTQM
jgi:phage gp45-like